MILNTYRQQLLVAAILEYVTEVAGVSHDIEYLLVASAAAWWAQPGGGQREQARDRNIYVNASSWLKMDTILIKVMEMVTMNSSETIGHLLVSMQQLLLLVAVTDRVTIDVHKIEHC
jgi:hypothetical protein